MTSGGEATVRAVGLDIGTARTKIVIDADAPAVHEPTALVNGPDGWRCGRAVLSAGERAEVHDRLPVRFAEHPGMAEPARLLTAFLRGLLGPVSRPRATLVAAVPDGWTAVSAEGIASTRAGPEFLRLLSEELGFVHSRLVPGPQCVAAAFVERTGWTGAGSLLLCDVGGHTVDAAVCALDGGTIRLLDAEQAELPRVVPHAAAGREPRGPVPLRHVVALDDERVRRARRAELVLDRAAVQDRYLGTPVYLAGEHGGALTAEVVLNALEPLSVRTAEVVRRLLDRTPDPLLPCAAITGGNAIGPVVPAVIAATNGLVGSAHRLDPSAAARGAWLIASGRITALDGYPHQLGLAIRRIRAGELESLTTPITTELEVEVAADHAGPLPVRIKLDGDGPWRDTRPAPAQPLPPGRYRVSALVRRAGLGAVLLRPVGGGQEIVQLLGSEVGPPVDEPGSRR